MDYRRKGKWEEIDYVRVFFSLTDNPEFCKKLYIGSLMVQFCANSALMLIFDNYSQLYGEQSEIQPDTGNY